MASEIKQMAGNYRSTAALLFAVCKTMIRRKKLAL